MIYITRRALTDAVFNEYNRAVKGNIESLYSCKALVYMPCNSDFIILQSYSTIVAAYQFSTRILWVFDFYSKTTSQHIAKFRNWIRYNTGWNYPKVVRLYNDSKTGKRAARKNLDDDFESAIESALNQ